MKLIKTINTFLVLAIIAVLIALLSTCCILLRAIPFVQNLTATLIGVLFGVPLAVIGALWVDRRITRQKIKERQRELLQLLQENLKTNEGIVKNNLDAPQNSWRDIVDLTLLESTAHVKYEIIEDMSLNKTLDSILYNLRIIHRIANIWEEIYIRDSNKLISPRENLLEIIKARGESTSQLIASAKTMIERNLLKVTHA